MIIIYVTDIYLVCEILVFFSVNTKKFDLACFTFMVFTNQYMFSGHWIGENC